MADVMALFSEKNTRDELGLGGICGTFANFLLLMASQQIDRYKASCAGE